MRQIGLEQVKCFEAVDGWGTILSYDAMPSPVRERLRNSPFNLCATCVCDGAWKRSDRNLPTLNAYMSTIVDMENQIRCEEV